MAAESRWWPASAKLNLYLHVTGRRADGFHLLDSLVAFSDIGDRLSVAPAPRLTLEITGPFARELAQENVQKNSSGAPRKRLPRGSAVRPTSR